MKILVFICLLYTAAVSPGYCVESYYLDEVKPETNTGLLVNTDVYAQAHPVVSPSQVKMPNHPVKVEAPAIVASNSKTVSPMQMIGNIVAVFITVGVIALALWMIVALISVFQWLNSLILNRR